MPYVNIKRSNMIGAVSKQIGKMFGDLSNQITTTSLTMMQDYRREACSVPRVTNRNRGKVNNISRNVSKINRRLSKIKRIPKKLKPPIKGLKAALKIILAIPIPQAVPPGIGIPVNVTTKFADLLHKVKEFIVQIEEDVDAIEYMIKEPSALSSTLSTSLERLDVATSACELEHSLKDSLDKGLTTEQELKDLQLIDQDGIYITSNLLPKIVGGGKALLPDGSTDGTRGGDKDTTASDPNEDFQEGSILIQSTLQRIKLSNLSDELKDDVKNTLDKFNNLYRANPSLQGLNSQDGLNNLNNSGGNTKQNRNAPPGSVLYTGPNGIVYSLVIKKDTQSPDIAPRRFAVAINPEGVEVLTGAKSFSSDTDVLIEEIKFRLDNQLP